MNRDCAITAALKRQQVTMFREAAKRGITASVIHYDTGGDNGGISESAIGQWARGETAMGLPMLLRLIGIVPDDLLSILLVGDRRIVKPAPSDHDDTAVHCVEYISEHTAARHPASECGVDIGPGEAKRLSAKRAQLAA